MERLLLVMENSGTEIPRPAPCDIFIASIGDDAFKTAFCLCLGLRRAGLFAECDHVGRSMKAQFKYADKIGARYVLVIGNDEMESGKGKLRSLEDKTEYPVLLEKDSILNHIKEALDE